MNPKKIVVLTGAGMSAESGLKTFRDADGLWEEYDVMEVCSTEGWARNPKLVLEFYNARRKQLLVAKPNAAHFGLHQLEQHYNVHIITQNVDNLHEQAGSRQVLHLHGELMKVRSTRNPALIYEVSPDQWEINPGDCGEDGAQLRPHIVFFGEAVPAIDQAIPICQDADILVIIGTSMNVYPAAGLIHYIKNDIPIYLIDPQPATIPVSNPLHVINSTAVKGVAQLLKTLMP